jgi:hypothetical protein
MKVYRYNEFITEESKIKNFIMSMLLSLGLSQADAQYIDSIQKAKIIEVLYDHNNKSNYNISELKDKLKLNDVNDVDSFIQSGLYIRPDKTIVIKPNFLPNIELYLNPERDRYGFSYRIPLN